MLNNRHTDDLVRIVLAGGGIDIDISSRQIDDIVRIALASKGRNPKIILRGMSSKPTDELVRIALASGGNVIFVD